MEIHPPSNSNPHILFRNVDPFILELLRQIPASADPGDNPKAKARLFSKPSPDPDDDFNKDWREFVEPDLRDLFAAATETVARDMDAARPVEDAGSDKLAFDLSIPLPHIDAWLNAIGQARIALTERFEITEDEISGKRVGNPDPERNTTLIQIEVYGFIQEYLVTISQTDHTAT